MTQNFNINEIKDASSISLLDEIIYYAQYHPEGEYWEAITDEIFRRLDKYDEIQYRLKMVMDKIKAIR